MSSVREEIASFTSQVPRSRPIFAVKASRDGDEVCLEMPKQNLPNFPEQDAIGYLVTKNYREEFDFTSKRYTFDEESLIYRINSEIRSKLVDFLAKNIESKKPTQTTLYKQWRRMSSMNNEELSYGMLLLYKYLYPHAGKRLLDLPRGSEHAKNGVLIMEKMMEKYDR
jgi:hypothetical protein